MTTSVREFDLPRGLEGRQVEKVATANRRAARLGLPPYEVEVERYDDAHFDERRGIRVVEPRSRITVTGEVPRIDGWEFIGTVDWSLSEPLVRMVPGVDVVPVHLAERRCDHCGTVRHRKDTYLVIGPDGEIRQVGRNCLAAYTGIPVGWVGDLMAGVEEVRPAGGGEFGYRPIDVLTFAVALVREHGYLSRSKARELEREGKATVDVMLRLWNDPQLREERDRLVESISATDEADAEAALEFAKGYEGAGEYARSLRIVAASDVIYDKHLAILVSAIGLARTDRATKTKPAVPAIPRDLGRVEVAGTVISAEYRDTDYGSTPKMLLETDEGWRLWGTVPEAIFSAADVEQTEKLEAAGAERGDWEPLVTYIRGRRVTFYASVTRSDDDETFGFFSRPTKATLTEEGGD